MPKQLVCCTSLLGTNSAAFYVEMLKARFQDEEKLPAAQRLLAHTLDTLLRLLSPVIPFVTEEIWSLLKEMAPERGIGKPTVAEKSITIAPWPTVDEQLIDESIESQFSAFQEVLAAVRNIRSQQNIPPKEKVEFYLRTSDDIAKQIKPFAGLLFVTGKI